MGEMKDKTPVPHPTTVGDLARSLSPAQRSALGTGMFGDAVCASYYATIEVLHRHGLIDRLLILTGLGRAVLKMIIDEPDIDELHHQAIRLDRDRTVLMTRDRTARPESVAEQIRRQFAKLNPPSALPPPRSAPRRPAIVDRIVSGGPAWAAGCGEDGVLLRHEDVNELRDYLLHETAGREFDARVIRRAQYDALRAVRRELRAWAADDPSGSPEVWQCDRIAASRFRRMIDEAARKLGLPRMPTDV